MKFYLLILMLIASLTTYASPALEKINNSNQLLLVRAPDWDATRAVLERYQRDENTHHWIRIGKPIPVVIGKKGMGWGTPFFPNSLSDPTKQEGDGKSPAGIFEIGSAFGFASPSSLLKMPYLQLTDTSFCVDDENSSHYNQVIDTRTITRDWAPNTGEAMRTQALYEKGAIIQYNTPNPIKHRGSCIFMHIWRNAYSGTAGCITMEKSNLELVLNWLDQTKNPLIALFPQNIYDNIKIQWKLPE